MSENLLPKMDPTFVSETIDALPTRLQTSLSEAVAESWQINGNTVRVGTCLLYTSPSPRD